MWTFAPDNRIQEHPARFGTADGEWTAVSGWLEGTFTKPMVLADGKVIQPTGKAYRIPMATIGHWNKGGHHVRGVPLLGQWRVHEADRARAIEHALVAKRRESRRASLVAKAKVAGSNPVFRSDVFRPGNGS